MLAPGASVKKAAGAVRQALQRDALRQQGYTWIDLEQYEHEVNVLQRFLVDTSVSGGALPRLLGDGTKPELSTLDVPKSVRTASAAQQQSWIGGVLLSRSLVFKLLEEYCEP